MAITVAGLYQTMVEVADQSAAARKPAIKNALIQVLVKLTGDSNIKSNENISALINSAERYVQQFRYQQAKLEDEQLEPATELWVQFDETAVNQALREYSLPVWGKERPSVLVWLAQEKNNIRNLISLDDELGYLKSIAESAETRGISLLFPLFDLEDTSAMSVSDLWAGFSEPVLNASARYQADIVLTGRLTQALPTLWEINWTTYTDDEVSIWSNQAELAEMVLEEGINELADRLAARYVNTGSTLAESIELTVSAINSVDDYAKTLSYLESLQAVVSVKVKRVIENEVMFELNSQGGFPVLEQALKLGKQLEQVNTNEKIVYRLLP